MPLRFRPDLGLGNQPLKLAAVIGIVWLILVIPVFHDRLRGPFDDAARDMLVLGLVPPAVVLACAGLLRLFGAPGARPDLRRPETAVAVRRIFEQQPTPVSA